MTVRISVAMCTYNGESFIGEQLASIASQSRPPDELVVCDDGSTDGTVEAVESFAASAPFEVRLRRNAERLGTAKNFERAAGLCSGEIVAFSDQDDVWNEDKIGILERRFREDEGPWALITDADVVDERLRPLGFGLWDSIGFDRAARARFERGGAVRRLLRMNVATGATMAVRRALLGVALPVPAGWMHDAWLALSAAVTDRLGLVDRRLVLYRQHPAAQIGSGRRGMRRRLSEGAAKGRDYYRRESERFAAAAQRLASRPDGPPAEAVAVLLEEKVRHLRARGGLPGPRPLRIPTVLGELLSGRYRRYSNGLVSCWKDLLFR